MCIMAVKLAYRGGEFLARVCCARKQGTDLNLYYLQEKQQPREFPWVRYRLGAKLIVSIRLRTPLLFCCNSETLSLCTAAPSFPLLSTCTVADVMTEVNALQHLPLTPLSANKCFKLLFFLFYQIHCILDYYFVNSVCNVLKAFRFKHFNT